MRKIKLSKIKKEWLIHPQISDRLIRIICSRDRETAQLQPKTLRSWATSLFPPTNMVLTPLSKRIRRIPCATRWTKRTLAPKYCRSQASQVTFAVLQVCTQLKRPRLFRWVGMTSAPRTAIHRGMLFTLTSSMRAATKHLKLSLVAMTVSLTLQSLPTSLE